MSSNSKNLDNTGVTKPEFYDQLTTEEALAKMVRINEELGLYDDYNKSTRNNSETQEAKLTLEK